ncbi:hypothetical protein ABZ615_27020 [Streptomyces sp. NPDC007325]
MDAFFSDGETLKEQAGFGLQPFKNRRRGRRRPKILGTHIA